MPIVIRWRVFSPLKAGSAACRVGVFFVFPSVPCWVAAAARGRSGRGRRVGRALGGAGGRLPVCPAPRHARSALSVRHCSFPSPARPGEPPPARAYIKTRTGLSGAPTELIRRPARKAPSGRCRARCSCRTPAATARRRAPLAARKGGESHQWRVAGAVGPRVSAAAGESARRRTHRDERGEAAAARARREREARNEAVPARTRVGAASRGASGCAQELDEVHHLPKQLRYGAQAQPAAALHHAACGAQRAERRRVIHSVHSARTALAHEAAAPLTTYTMAAARRGGHSERARPRVSPACCRTRYGVALFRDARCAQRVRLRGIIIINWMCVCVSGTAPCSGS